jgi:hypothetical protein
MPLIALGFSKAAEVVLDFLASKLAAAVDLEARRRPGA